MSVDRGSPAWQTFPEGKEEQTRQAFESSLPGFKEKSEPKPAPKPQSRLIMVLRTSRVARWASFAALSARLAAKISFPLVSLAAQVLVTSSRFEAHLKPLAGLITVQ